MQVGASLILDILLIVILVLTVVSYNRKGFLAAICELAGSIAAAVGAFFCASRLSAGLFESFFKAGLVEKAGAALTQAAGAVQTSEIVRDMLSFLPDNMVSGIMQSLDQFLEGAGTLPPEVASQLVDSVIAPVVVPLISIVVFFVIFALAKLLVAFVTAAFTGVNKVPLLGGVNRMFGTAAGFVAGFINIYIVVCAVAAIAMVTADGIGFLNTAMLQKSFFGGLLWNINPFV